LELNSLTDADDSQEADGSEVKECEDLIVHFDNQNYIQLIESSLQ